MASESFRRKLTSILSADVQDYSRLMGADEVGTLQRLNESRTIIDRTIAAHRGRVVNTAGDSVLAEFESPVEAVQCAAEMQDEIAARNSALADDQKMRWRVGINLGDVMIDGDNIFGDGVNIAARLQALAEAGGICISGAAYDLVEARLPYTYVALGEQRVKNIARPVRAYRVVAGEKSIPAAEPRSPRRRRWFRPGRAVGGISVVALVWAILAGPPATTDPGMTPAVAVLPFRAIGDAAAEVEFSEGLTEDVIVALSAQTELRVVLSDEPGSPQEVGARLHVAYVLDGRVRRAGDTLRITAQLSETPSGYHLWGGRYDRMTVDVLVVQEEVAEKIVATLAQKLAEAEGERMSDDAASDGQSYLMIGIAYLGRFAEDAVTYPQQLLRSLRGAARQEDSEVVERSSEVRLAPDRSSGFT